MELGFEIIIVLLLILLNGLFSMTELALVSARRARLMVMERKGVVGATTARLLVAIDGQRNLGVYTGAPVRISMAREQVALVQHLGYAHFAVVRAKLCRWCGV